MADQVLLPGTLLRRKDVHFGVVNHYGVVLQSWPCFVAHIDKAPGGGHLRVKVESFEAFAQGRPVACEPVSEPVPLHAMWTRVNEVAQTRRPFGLLCWGQSWNCESFARFVKNGIAHSEQASNANGVLLFASVIGGLALLLSGGNDAKWDATVGRYRNKSGQFTSK